MSDETKSALRTQPPLDLSGPLHNLWLRTTDQADRDTLYQASGRIYRLEKALGVALQHLDSMSSSDPAYAVRAALLEADLDSIRETHR